MNISGTQVLRDSQGRAVPQYYDYVSGTFKPMSIEDVSHVNVLQTTAQYGRHSSTYVVYPNQYLGADGQWYVYNPLTYRADHDEDIDLSLIVKSVNGVLPDADGNVQLICEHPEPDLSAYIKTVEGEGPDANGNVDIQFPSIDLSNYATLLDLEDFVSNAQLDAYAKLTDIPEAQDLSPYALRTDLSQLEFDLGEYLEDYATLDDLTEFVERGELPEFNDFATKVELYQELNNYVNHAEADAFARVSELPDLEPYALKSDIIKPQKIHTAIATVTENGAWSIDYTSAGFDRVLNVTPTPLAQAETAAHMPTHSNITSISNTGASGIAYKASSAGLLAAMQQVRAEAGTLIQVLVIGE